MGKKIALMLSPLLFLAANAGCVAQSDAAVADAEAVKAETEKPAAGPLATYVAKPDASYQWKKRREGKFGGASYVELILTSQTWKNVAWKHQLFVLRPASVPADAKHALLFISGGKWSDRLENAPGEEEKFPKETPIFVALAEQLKTPVAILLQVPHQPILGGKYEDDAIAETFVNFMRTGDSEWPLLLPMVKSAVRGMDATTELAAKEWKLDIKTFTVTGASKRGWTTWLTGAIDPRATAIAPMVIDMLNTAEQMKHQVATWGKPSEQIEDYTRRGLQNHLATKQGEALNAIVDPYSYRKKLTQPKLVMLGTNDRYWPLDALNLYWDGLEGEKHILYIPNNGHGLNDVVRISGTLAALHRRAVEGVALPKLAWKLTESVTGLAMEIDSDVQPKEVRAWIATSPTKDFRDAKWKSAPTTVTGRTYLHQLAMPKEGYAAMFGEATYNGAATPFFLSTNVKIIGNGNGKSAAGGK